MLCCINFGDLTYRSISVDDSGIHTSDFGADTVVVGIVDLVVVVVDSVVDGSVVVDLINRCVVDDVDVLLGVFVML